jgi:glycine cleavage system regulatory protein
MNALAFFSKAKPKRAQAPEETMKAAVEPMDRRTIISDIAKVFSNCRSKLSL